MGYRIVSKQLHPANTQNGCGSGCRPATPTGRNTKAVFQGSSNRSWLRGSKSRLLLQPLSCPEEGRRKEAGNKPKEPQRIRCPPTIQDGGATHAERLLNKNDWLMKIDLKDAFFMIPMHKSCRETLFFSRRP